MKHVCLLSHEECLIKIVGMVIKGLKFNSTRPNQPNTLIWIQKKCCLVKENSLSCVTEVSSCPQTLAPTVVNRSSVKHCFFLNMGQ
jgi:hypothetical protein